MRQSFQTDLEADRQVANALAELIIGGSLASTAATASLANHMQKTLSLFEKGLLALVAEKDLNLDPWVMSHTTRISAVMNCLWPLR